MTEGLLQKRIEKYQKERGFNDWGGEEVKACCDNVLKVVEEMKTEFPLEEFNPKERVKYVSPKDFLIQLAIKREKWFVKWLT